MPLLYNQKQMLLARSRPYSGYLCPQASLKPYIGQGLPLFAAQIRKVEKKGNKEGMSGWARLHIYNQNTESTTTCKN